MKRLYHSWGYPNAAALSIVILLQATSGCFLLQTEYTQKSSPWSMALRFSSNRG